jgi:HAMP domain-containing protein
LALLLFSFGGIIWTNRSTANAEIISGMESILSNVSASTTARSEDFLADARASAEIAAVTLTGGALETPAELERYFGALLESNLSANGAFYGTVEGEFVYVSRSESGSSDGFRTKLISMAEGSRIVELVYRDSQFAVTGTELDPDDQYDPRERPWFQSATEESRTILTDPYVFFTSQRPGITAAAPVFGSDRSISGVVGVDIELSELSAFLGDLSLGENGSAFVFNPQGEVIALEDLDRIRQPDGQGFRLASVTDVGSPVLEASFEAISDLGSESETFNVDDGGSTLHAFVAPIDQTDWILGVALDEQDFLGDVQSEQQRSNLIALALGLIGIAVGWRLMQNVTVPLTELRNRARDIEAGKLIETEPSHAVINELRATSDAFDHMVKGLLDQRQHDSDRATAAGSVEEHTIDLDDEDITGATAEAKDSHR